MAKAACSRPHPSSADLAAVVLDARAHHDLHHVNVAASATTTKWIAESSPLALRIACASAIDSGMQHHLVHADKWLACPVRAQGERRRFRNLMLCARLGTRTVREPLCDCTVLCVGRARTGHGCQSDNYYRCAGSCAVQATGWPTAAAVYWIFRILRQLEMKPTSHSPVTSATPDTRRTRRVTRTP